ncbi:hypothetical protein QE152_g35671 [Popillia japonica]|uniref:Reverse transcriptase Ty1/copia-type domain-containing protein n=1 Tax=Popillia japonica TaxID=7064 RepID=A0AAW1IFQ3_POPJA
MKRAISEKFETRDLGILRHVQSIRVETNGNRIRIDQTAYAIEILKEFNMFGHTNYEYLNKTEKVVEGLILTNELKTDKLNYECYEVCCEAKQCRLPFPNKGNRAKDLLQIIHADTKNEVIEYSKEFKTLAENQ